MAKRSLKASEVGRVTAKKAFERTGWTQEYLAYQVGLETRQSVWKFFSGRPVDRNIFIDLCFQLDLEWEDIIDAPIHPEKGKKTAKILESESIFTELKSYLTPKLREPLQLTLMPFDVCQPLPLKNIYTPLYFLPSISSQRWMEVNELSPSGSGNQRMALTQNSAQNQASLDVAQQTQKLVILGKPGAGKTTFLHHIASQCLSGEVFPKSLPIFISLRSFIAQYSDNNFPDLETYLQSQLVDDKFTAAHVTSYLKAGRFLILIDGLDEINTKALQPLFHCLQNWASVYAANSFILTCRLAAQQFLFQGFSYSELADFNTEQIDQFVKQFFTAVSLDEIQGDKKAQDFLDQLYRKQNQPIRELVATPILLNLICSIFQARKTLPTNRAKLYQVGLDILLGRWDQARGIDRKQHSTLPLSKVERLKLLSHLAAKTFEKEQFYFDKQDILHIIAEYLQQNPPQRPDDQEPIPQDAESLWAYSENIIQTIETQNGLLVERAKDIYSFSHLTFQEYLTARKIAATPADQGLEEVLQQLSTRVNQYHWREVIFLTVNLLPEPIPLLNMLQSHIRSTLAEKPKMNQFLAMIKAKTETLDLAYPKWALRAFYFSTLINADLKLAFAVEPLFANQLSEELSLDLALIRLLNKMEQVLDSFSIQNILNIYFALNFDLQFQLEPKFQADIQKLKGDLPEYADGKKNQLEWWKLNGEPWIHRWYDMIRTHRNLALDWQWTQAEAKKLLTYYQANQILVDCLQYEARVTGEERESIMANILLGSDEGG